LFESEAEQLRQWFDESSVLIANLILQTMRYLAAGVGIHYGTEHRGFWYRPIKTMLYRAGFITARQLRWREDKDEASERYHRLLVRLVGDPPGHFSRTGF